MPSTAHRHRPPSPHSGPRPDLPLPQSSPQQPSPSQPSPQQPASQYSSSQPQPTSQPQATSQPLSFLPNRLKPLHGRQPSRKTVGRGAHCDVATWQGAHPLPAKSPEPAQPVANRHTMPANAMHCLIRLSPLCDQRRRGADVQRAIRPRGPGMRLGSRSGPIPRLARSKPAKLISAAESAESNKSLRLRRGGRHFNLTCRLGEVDLE